MSKATFEMVVFGIAVLFLVLYLMRRRARRNNLLQ